MRQSARLLLICLTVLLPMSARAFDGAIRMQMASQIPPMGTCTQLSASWTPQWASLKGYWKLDGADSVPIAAGTVVPAIIGKVASMENANGTGAAHAYGIMGNGMAIDGTDDNVVVSASSSYEVANITIAMWIKLNALPTSGNSVLAVSKLQSSGYGLSVQSGGAINFQVWSGGAYRLATSATGAIDIGNWHHLVGTYDGTSVVVYLDGVANATTAYTGVISYPTNNALCIGADAGANNTACTGNRRVNGTIDDVAIWNVGLTSAEIATLYNRTGCTN